MAIKKKEETDVVRWEDQMAAEAEVAAKMEEGVGGGQFFSLKSGVLSWQDTPIPGNQMAVIILDSVLENVYYEGPYDPDVPQSPACFAFGRNAKEMTPHDVVIEAGTNCSDACDGCENNEFGSADIGKGKACRNTRRLAMIPAGTFNKDGELEIYDTEEHYQTATPAYMKLPVMSVKGYASFVTQIANTLKRPPYGIVTKVSVIPDAKSQFRVVFQALELVKNEYMPIVMERHKEIAATIDFPYVVDEEEEKPKKSKAAQKPGKSKKKSRKY